MTIVEARTHYRTILRLLNAERTMRLRVLSEPRKSQAIDEIDAALAALERLGQIVHAAHEAGLLESIPEQGTLLDRPTQNHTHEAAMTNTQPPDILAKLNRILILTPETAFAVPPVARQTIVQAAIEIANLRRRLAQLETQPAPVDPQR